jgi:hypothetical protein
MMPRRMPGAHIIAFVAVWMIGRPDIRCIPQPGRGILLRAEPHERGDRVGHGTPIIRVSSRWHLRTVVHCGAGELWFHLRVEIGSEKDHGDSPTTAPHAVDAPDGMCVVIIARAIRAPEEITRSSGGGSMGKVVPVVSA